MVVTFSLDFICSMTTIFLYNAWPSIHSLNCASEPIVVEMKSYGNCISKQQIILCISELEIISITSYSIPSKFTTHCQSLQFAWFCYFRYNHKLYSLALFLQLCRLYHQLALICSLVAQLRIATEKLHWLYVWRWSLQQKDEHWLLPNFRCQWAK